MRIVEMTPQQGFRLFVRYDDGAAGVLDLSPLAGWGVFGAWLKPGIFEQVRLSEAGAPEWPGDVDLCPDALYMELAGKTAEEILPGLRRVPSHA